MFLHIHIYTHRALFYITWSHIFPLAYLLDLFTWYHIWRLHCSNIISLSAPRTQPAPTSIPDLSLKVWASSGIPPALNGTPIHPPEYDRNLEIILDISSCRSPRQRQIQFTAHSWCYLLLKKSFLTSSSRHRPCPGGLRLHLGITKVALDLVCGKQFWPLQPLLHKAAKMPFLKCKFDLVPLKTLPKTSHRF